VSRILKVQRPGDWHKSDHDHRNCKCILEWLATAIRVLSVQELQIAVELSLDDGFGNFGEYIINRCGSVLEFPTGNEGNTNVNLIHPLQSFLLDPKRSKSLCIDEVGVDKMVRVVCRKVVNSNESEYDGLRKYASDYSNHHEIWWK
jgi:hypothetical protein